MDTTAESEDFKDGMNSEVQKGKSSNKTDTRAKYLSCSTPSNKLNGISNERKKSKDVEKIRSQQLVGRNKYQHKYVQPSVKKKYVPASNYIYNPATEAVLRERKVEIKDLESQVVYLQSHIKELKIENKTLLDLQARSEKELKHFKGGISDIPSLLRSHKDEMKAMEATAISLRKELRDSQKELKSKSDIMLRKDLQLDKLNLTLKQTGKHMQEIIHLNKELKQHKKVLQDEKKKLLNGNEELKSNNEQFQTKLQEMKNKTENLEGKLLTVEKIKNQLQDDLCKLQKSFDESVQREMALKNLLETTKLDKNTQTEKLKLTSTSSMTEDLYSGCGDCHKNEEVFKVRRGQTDFQNKTKTESRHTLPNCFCSAHKESYNAGKNLPFGFPGYNLEGTKPESRMGKFTLQPINAQSSPNDHIQLTTEREHCRGEKKCLKVSFASPTNEMVLEEPFIEDGPEADFTWKLNYIRDSRPKQKHRKSLSNFTAKEMCKAQDTIEI